MNALQTDTVSLRAVRPTDAEAVAAIYNYYVECTTVTFEEKPVGMSEMRERIKVTAAVYPYIVAETGAGEIVGYCYAHLWKRFSAYSHTFETTVYLRNGYTSHGVGRRLMDRLIDECRSMGCRALIACITSENDGSLRFHGSLGFEPVSHFREVGYKHGRYLDVIDMELRL